jgi:nicotinate-nucleotide adenylyltransferase
MVLLAMVNRFRASGMDKIKQTASNTIGLLGGSFDPPHVGHLFISEDALQRFGLDQVWWVVAKQNTLKANKPRDFEERIALCNNLLKEESKLLVSDLEKNIESHDTIDVLNFIRRTSPNEYFWIMGSDSLFTFDQWPGWEQILSSVKLIVYDRPGFLYKNNESKLNPLLKSYKKTIAEFQHCPLPAWTLVGVSAPAISSTEIRLKETGQ